jgi:hypothetical protein
LLIFTCIHLYLFIFTYIYLFYYLFKDILMIMHKVIIKFLCAFLHIKSPILVIEESLELFVKNQTNNKKNLKVNLSFFPIFRNYLKKKKKKKMQCNLYFLFKQKIPFNN